MTWKLDVQSFENGQILDYLIYNVLPQVPTIQLRGREKKPKQGSKKEKTQKKAEEQENGNSVERLISLHLLPPQPGITTPC